MRLDWNEVRELVKNIAGSDVQAGFGSWYEIRNAADPEAADVYLYDEIGYWGVTANDFARDLRDVTAPTINLHVNSPGGEVFDGIAIYNAIKNHPATVNVTVDGIAASSASFIIQAADRITMAKNATLMIHEPYAFIDAFANGNADDMRSIADQAVKLAETLDLVAEQIADMYTGRNDKSADEWRNAMRAETWYKAQQAVDAGLADEVAGAASAKNAVPRRVFNFSRFKNVPTWAAKAAASRAGRAPRDAGRTMSQNNLDKLHGAMSDIAGVHDGTCDMGTDCPVSTTVSNRSSATVRAESGVVCIVPDCDEPWAINLPLCKDHAGMVMELSGDPPNPAAEPTGDLEVNNEDDGYRYRASLIGIDSALISVGGKVAA